MPANLSPQGAYILFSGSTDSPKPTSIEGASALDGWFGVLVIKAVLRFSSFSIGEQRLCANLKHGTANFLWLLLQMLVALQI